MASRKHPHDLMHSIIDLSFSFFASTYFLFSPTLSPAWLECVSLALVITESSTQSQGPPCMMNARINASKSQINGDFTRKSHQCIVMMTMSRGEHKSTTFSLTLPCSSAPGFTKNMQHVKDTWNNNGNLPVSFIKQVQSVDKSSLNSVLTWLCAIS